VLGYRVEGCAVGETDGENDGEALGVNDGDIDGESVKG